MNLSTRSISRRLNVEHLEPRVVFAVDELSAIQLQAVIDPITLEGLQCFIPEAVPELTSTASPGDIIPLPAEEVGAVVALNEQEVVFVRYREAPGIGPDWMHAVELWKSDGTDEGTVLLEDFSEYTTPDGSTIAGEIQNLMLDDDGNIYFAASVHSRQSGLNASALVWKTDGSSEGTELLTTLPMWNSAGAPGYRPVLSSLVHIDGYTMFSVGIINYYLIRTDGTAEETAGVPFNNMLLLLDESMRGIPSAEWLEANYERIVAEGGPFGEPHNIFPETPPTAPVPPPPVPEVPPRSDIVRSFTLGERTVHQTRTPENGFPPLLVTSTESPSEYVELANDVGEVIQINDHEVLFAKYVVTSQVDLNGHPIPAVQLWKTDGTAEGTVLIEDFGEFMAPDETAYVQSIVDFATDENGDAYFTTYVYGGNGWHPTSAQLWTVSASDGEAKLLHTFPLDRSLLVPRISKILHIDGATVFTVGYMTPFVMRTDGTAEGTENLGMFYYTSGGLPPAERIEEEYRRLVSVAPTEEPEQIADPPASIPETEIPTPIENSPIVESVITPEEPIPPTIPDEVNEAPIATEVEEAPIATPSLPQAVLLVAGVTPTSSQAVAEPVADDPVFAPSYDLVSPANHDLAVDELLADTIRGVRSSSVRRKR